MPLVVAGQGQHWTMIELELVVVIILDQREAELLGQQGEVKAAFRLEDHRGGELVMRRDVDSPHLALPAQTFELVELNPLCIDADAGNLRACGQKCLPRRWVTQGFHDHYVTRPHKHPRCEVDPHLATAYQADV